MGLEEVEEDILSAGHERAERVRREALSERERLLAEAGENARLLSEKRLREAEREAARFRARELSGGELEVRRLRLSMERELLEEAARRARERLSALPREEDERLLLALAGRAPAGYLVRGARKNETFLRSRFGAAHAGSIECLGGLAFESPDGSVRVDLTYDALLREAVERSLKDVFELLFSR